MTENITTDTSEPETQASQEEQPKPRNPFQRNLDVFISRVDSLHDHGTQAVVVITQSHKHVQAEFDAFLAAEASPVDGEEDAVTIPEDKLTRFRRLQRKRTRSGNAVRSVPRALAVALVSEFDAFMGATLKSFYRLKPDALQAAQRTITFAELVKFGSIDAARDHFLEKEVESFLRSSHSEQFETLESKIGTPLRKELPVWKDFVELTERRNLFVHNDGVVNSQYLNICGSAGVDCRDVGKGTTLDVSQKYFTKAHDTLYEIAAKLSHVLWRKLLPEDRERADAHFAGTLVYDLLQEERFRLARTLADFGVTTFKQWGSDYYRRALIINRAQAYIWGGERAGGIKILADEDWSASSDDFRLCVAALRREFPESIRRMRALGLTAGPKKDGFREWPVFKELRKDKDFQAAFGEIFGEPFARVTVSSQGEPEAGDRQRDAAAPAVAQEGGDVGSSGDGNCDGLTSASSE